VISAAFELLTTIPSPSLCTITTSVTMIRTEWITTQKSRIMSIVHTKVELGQSVRGLWKEKQQSEALERGE
jgi:hypothetical protein